MKKQYLQPEVSDASEVLHLKLWDGTAFDYSLNGNVSALKGTAYYSYPGVVFDGDSDYIETDDAAILSPAGTAMTFCAWVNMVDATLFTVLGKGVAGTTGEYRFQVGGGDKVFLKIYDESEVACYIGRKYDSVITSYEGQWMHLCSTYDGGTASSGIKIYMNGAQVDDVDDESNAVNFVAVEDLGGTVRSGEYDTAFSDGSVDDIRIYDTVQTPAQIRNLYEQTRWRYGV